MVNAIVLFSVIAGFLSAWYYIELLYNPVDIINVFKLIGSYAVWILFVVTIVLVG